jgi:membrane associated rhomboid family serine protease
MRDAAVGFQCPQCVAEGARTTRTGRTAYGGPRPGNASLTSMVLIAVNAAVWLLVMATGGAASAWLNRLMLLPTGRCVSVGRPDLYFPSIGSEAVCSTNPQGDWINGVSDGAYWQLFTSAFTHVEIWHIGFNMLALWFLGPQLEMAVGRVRFLALYLISALAGSTLVYWLAPVDGSTLGASGAIFGLMGGLLVVAFKVGGNVQPILMWIGINFLITVVGRGFISWQGHLGGFLGGVLVALVLVYSPRPHRTLWQSLGLSAITLCLVVAVLLRTAVLA